jgi:two-component system OmpR family response regulator
MRVLIVDDDVPLAALIRRILRRAGLVADVAITGEDALWMATSTPYEVLLVDLSLPGIDGVETCERLRANGVRTPIVVVSARAAVADRVTALDTGADDYMVKPFDPDELLARIRAAARRGPTERSTVLRVGDLTLDPATCTVQRGEAEIPLVTKELQVLEVFMRRPGRVLTRYDVLEGAWDMNYENRSNIVDVYVRSLREKIDRPFGVESIETVRGVGYRLRRKADAEDDLPSGARAA